MKTVIEKSKKLINLLEELEESIAYEKCKYHLIKDNSFSMIVYMLIDIATKKILKSGKIEHIKSFINLRNVDISSIFMDKNVKITLPIKKDGKFLKGNVPWNKGKKGIHVSPATEFKPGQNAGKDSFNWKGGIQKMKNDCVHLHSGTNQRIRRPVAYYEQFIGPIPKGYVIFHLNGDKNDDTPNNLEAISRAELLKRNLKK